MSKLSISASFENFDDGWCKNVPNLNQIEVDSNIKNFIYNNGLLIDKNKNEIVVAGRDLIGIVKTPSQIKRICPYSFDQCTKIKSVNCQSTELEAIDTLSFNKSIELEKIAFQTSKNMKINQLCFSNCSNLKSIFFMSPKLSFNDVAFDSCLSISNVKISCKNNISVFSYLLNDYISLKYIEISTKSNLYLTEDCFSNATKLEVAIFETKNINFEKNLFEKCTMFAYVSIKCENSIEITADMFKNCESLFEVDINASNTLHLKTDCFNEKQTLRKIELKGKKEKIDENCFNDCYSLYIFVISGTEKVKIKSNQFFNFINIKEYLKLVQNCFLGADELMNLSIIGGDILNNNDVHSDFPVLLHFSIIQANYVFIEESQFKNSKNIETIKIQSETIISIGSNCFEKCERLKSLKLEADDVFIGKNCFKNCSSLEIVDFDLASKINMEQFAFSMCLSLVDIFISASSCLFVGENCFSECENLHSVKFNANHISIKQDSFKKCHSLVSVEILPLKTKHSQNDSEDDSITYYYYSINRVCRVIIGKNVFSSLKKVEKLKICADELVQLCNGCFYKSNKFSTVIINAPNIIIDDYFFANC